MALGRIYRPVVEPDDCQSCRVCQRACPAETLPELRTGPETLRGRLYQGTDLGARDALPPCEAACPLGQGVSGYVGLMARGAWREALLAIRAENPLPSVCGYLCHHPCQRECLRGALDTPVAIRDLKRLATRYEVEHETEVVEALRERKRPSNGRRVAVVGSGPAGLTAAHDLLMAGCSVTVIEGAAAPGGALRLAIPEFRLPRRVVDHEIRVLSGLGVELHTGTRVSRPEELTALRGDFDAVLLAFGAQQGDGLAVRGWAAPGCWDALSFLQGFNRGEAPALSGTVLVVGVGNVALDAARAALRGGAARVRVVYRRDRAQMPAALEDVREAETEGVDFVFRALPEEVLRGTGRVTGLSCRETEPGPTGEDRRPAVRLTDRTRVLAGDAILSAVGQSPFHPCLPPEARREDGRLTLTPDGQVHAHPGVYGAGDGVHGPGYVVDAMASGRAAAAHILTHLEQGA